MATAGSVSTRTTTAGATSGVAVVNGRAAGIWGPMKLEFIVVSGEFGQGKTLFLTTIDPTRTLVYDNEGSSANYEGLGFERVDVALEMMKSHPGGYTPKQRFLWWRNDIKKRVTPGKYTVVAVDPVSEIEAGLADYVYDSPAEFGYTKQQFDKSSGLYWGCVKDAWKMLLDDLRVRTQTFGVTVHMRAEWRGNTPTGKREAKGKETLRELASLFIEVERKPDAKGNVPDVPSAVVKKSRLAHTSIVDGKPQVLPVLPPRLPQATPDAIRGYIAKPADYHKLKAAERLQEDVLSEAEKLRLQAVISENNKETATAELSRLEKMQAAAAAQAAAVAGQRPSSDQSAEMAQAVRDKAEANGHAAQVEKLNQEISEHEAKSPLCDESQYQAIMHLIRGGAYENPEDFRAYLMRTYSAAVLKLLKREQAVEVIEHLKGLLARKGASGNASGGTTAEATNPAAGSAQPDGGQAAENPAAGDPPFVPDAEQKTKPSVVGTASHGDNTQAWAARAADERKKMLDENNGYATKAQLERMKGLIDRLQVPLEIQQRSLQQNYGVNSYRSLTVDQANTVIDNLVRKELEQSAGAAGPN